MIYNQNIHLGYYYQKTTRNSGFLVVLTKFLCSAITRLKGQLKMKNTIPLTEQQEQEAFVAWCRLRGYRLHHSPNEVGGSSNQMKLRAIKMKKMGTSKGFPDLLVFVPFSGVDNEIDAYQPIAIEMKRTKGSTTSPEQKVWGEILEKAGIPFRVCKGCEEAIKAVNEIVGGLDNAF